METETEIKTIDEAETVDTETVDTETVDYAILNDDGSLTFGKRGAEGYLPVVMPEAARGAVGWFVKDGQIVPSYSDGEADGARTFSKLKIYLALVKAGLWERVEAALNEVGLYTAFVLANDLREDDPNFTAAMAAFKERLGVTDGQIEDVLARCVADR